MAAANIPPSFPVNESNIFKVLLPNRGRTKGCACVDCDQREDISGIVRGTIGRLLKVM